jgi:hypothetical protein
LLALCDASLHHYQMRHLALAYCMITGFVVLGGCVQFGPQNPPLLVNVKSDGDNCRVTVQRVAQTPEFVRVSQAQLLEIGRQTKALRAVVIYDMNAKYKCIGAAILTLQQAGLAVDPALWDSRQVSKCPQWVGNGHQRT